jgi:redox-sensing transcriptional repressor
MEQHPNVPRPCLMRLPHYYRRLLQARQDKQQIISSQELGDEAGVPAAQARKDLGYLGEVGRPGVGYNVRQLMAQLEEFLGLKIPKNAVLIGLSHLGRALASYPGFSRYRLQIAGIFDHNPGKIGSQIGGSQVYALDDLASFVRKHDISIGILAVSALQAQGTAERMAEAGIRVIWNFAPVALRVPDHVMVFNEDLAARLATMSYYIMQHEHTSGPQE